MSTEKAREAEEGMRETSQPLPGSPDVSYSLVITPQEAKKNSVLRLKATGFHLSDAVIEWFVNDVPNTTTAGHTFISSDIVRGDEIYAIARVKGTEIESNSLVIGNTAPEVKRIALLPEVFRPGDTLLLDARASDVDGDDVILQYRWTVNGELVSETNTLNFSLKRGDKITAKVIPFDEEDYGPPAVLTREIVNFPPMIIDHKNFTFDGKTYSYQIKAADPDGDSLSYSLSSAPEGMTIDPDTGLLQWSVPEDFRGKASVSVVVADGHNGVSQYGLNITID